MRLYDWQADCLKKWEENGFAGIVNVVTGAGKTVLALAAVKRLEALSPRQSLKVKIIVPKTFLVRQWARALRERLGASRKDIGVYSGAHKGDTNRKYMIYVVNSARYSFTRHLLKDSGNRILIIADECHHYGTAENFKIFDFKKVITNKFHIYTLGLSATPYGKNYADVLEPCLGREIYRYTFAQALDAGIINRFSVLNVRVEFTADEMAEYGELSDKLGLALRELRKSCPRLGSREGKRFFLELDNIIKTDASQDIRQLARTVLILSYRRKAVVYMAENRIKCVTDLVGMIDKKAKIIIFGERIDMAEEIYERLESLLPGESGIYHSKISKDAGRNVLRDFEESRARILVSCKTLDEGLDVTGADVGIIASSTSSERQRIQRLGRILRKKEGGGQAYFYHLYVNGTMEEKEVFSELTGRTLKGVNIIDLYYDDKTGTFTNPFYGELADKAICGAEKRLWDSDKIGELRRNIRLGAILCDWWMTEGECLEKIRTSSRKRERNYYIAMLLLIRTRNV